MDRRMRLVGLGLLGLFYLVVASGCGILTIRTQVTIDEELTSGAVIFDFPEPRQDLRVPLQIMQGNLLTQVETDTSQILANQLHIIGTITLEQLNLAGRFDPPIGFLCFFNSPFGVSSGPLDIDLVGGNSSASVDLDAFIQTEIQQQINSPATPLQDTLAFDLGDAFGAEGALALIADSSVDGAFTGEQQIAQQIDFFGLQVVTELNLSITNGPKPAAFNADLYGNCGSYFAAQGRRDWVFQLNPKRSYLKANNGDEPVEPIVVPLADIRVLPVDANGNYTTHKLPNGLIVPFTRPLQAGDEVEFSAIGTYSGGFTLMDGTETQVAGVFSQTDTVLPATQRFRIPGAVGGTGAPAFVSAPHQNCTLIIICTDDPTDIPEDFRIDPSVRVTVPAGAQYLVLAPVSPDLRWDDNFNLGFAVSLKPRPDDPNPRLPRELPVPPPPAG